MLVQRLATLLIALFSFSFSGQVRAEYVPQPDTFRRMLVGPDGVQVGARLGTSVAVSPQWVALGAPRDCTGGLEAGVVKIFDATTGNHVWTLPNPQPGGMGFGLAVAIHGSRVAVSAPTFDYDTTWSSGRVYLFDLASANPASPVHTIESPDAGGEEQRTFGDSLVLTANRLFVGAARQHSETAANGRIYVYDVSAANPVSPSFTIPSPEPGAYDSFGCAMALEGNRLVVGARTGGGGLPYSTGPGRAYVFDLGGATPTVPVMELTKSRFEEGFGASVGLSGDRIIVGAPGWDRARGMACLFDLSSAFPTFAVAEFFGSSADGWQFFGASVAISGNRAVVTCTRGGALGYARLFDLDATYPGNPIHTFQSPGGPSENGFGDHVAMMGTRVVITAPGDEGNIPQPGSAFIFNALAPSTAPTVLHHPGIGAFSFFGSTLGISGSRLAVSGGYKGGVRVMVHDLSAANPAVPSVTIQDPSQNLPSRFGPLSISGTRLVVGAWGESSAASNSGRAYVYDLSGPNPAVPVLVLSNPTPAADDYFGQTVAVFGDRLLVAAPGDDAGGANAGVVYEYNLAGANPATPVRVLTNPAPATSTSFGKTMALSATRAMISANYQTASVPDIGVVHAFDFSGENPSIAMATLSAPVSTAYLGFGSALAMDGSTAVVGAMGFDGDFQNEGIAYVYDLAGPTPGSVKLSLRSDNPSAGAGFGAGVAIAGSRVAVGEQYALLGRPGSGRVQVFDLAGATPDTALATLTDSVGMPSYGFGSVLAMAGTTLAVGAPQKTERMFDRGAVLVFGPSPFTAWKHDVLGNHLAPDESDSDSDRISLLAGYGLGLSPLAPEANAVASQRFAYADGERLRLFVNRDPNRSDVTLEVQAAGEITGPWETVANSRAGEPFTGPGYVGGDDAAPGVKAVEIRDVLKISEAAQRFLRVKVGR